MKTYRLWTDDDLAILKRHYPVEGPKACAALLGRSLKSVYQRAFELNLKRKPE